MLLLLLLLLLLASLRLNSKVSRLREMSTG